MTFDFCLGFVIRSCGFFRLVGRRWVQIEQMALPFAFGETLSTPAEGPTLVPGQFVQRGGVLLFEFFKRGGRFVQHTIQFRGLLLCFGRTLLGFIGVLLKLHRLPIGSQQKLVAFGQVIRQ